MKTYKNILIPWSGGLDSTYLIYKALKEGNNVTTSTCGLLNNEHQMEMEKRAMIKLKLAFSHNDMHFNSYNNQIKIDYNGQFHLSQPPIWLLTSLLNSTEHIDEIWIGYVLKDDANSYIKEISGIFNSMKQLMYNKDIKLMFPLTKTSKSEIFEKLPIEISKDIVYCETPILDKETDNYSPCNKCSSCVKHNLYFNRKLLNL